MNDAASKAPAENMDDRDVMDMLKDLSLSHDELEHYLTAQLQEINKYKWILSEQASRDIGFQHAALEWIDRYGKPYFEHYWRNRIAERQRQDSGDYQAA